MDSVQKTASAAGKIIVSGEYAVIFGKPGIAVPSGRRMVVEWHPAREANGGIHVIWEGITGDERWDIYTRDILRRIDPHLSGTLTIRNALPLGKGMGSSTALVIAIGRCLLLSSTQRTSVGQERSCPTDVRKAILAIEDAVNPGHSGIDFAVIWDEHPVIFRKGQEPEPIGLPVSILEGAVLIDTGAPNETTPELVAWIRARKVTEDTKETKDGKRSSSNIVIESLASIDGCTERILGFCSRHIDLSIHRSAAKLIPIIRDHHRAQVALGVVTQTAQDLIVAIEAAGGAAKVIGAGGRTGGSGMVLALGIDQKTIREIAHRFRMPLYTL